MVSKIDMARSADCDRRLIALEQMLKDGRPRSAIELACIERQRKDLLTGHERGLVWNEEEVCKTIGQTTFLRHRQGPQANNKFTLEPWQEHLVFAPLYGWQVERKGRLVRRFTDGYLEVPRKNGKTFMVSAMGIKGLIGDNEGGPAVYCAASSRDQAKHILDDMQHFVRSSSILQQRITLRAYSLLGKHNNGVAKTVSSEGYTTHGTNPSVGLVDELHAHPNNKIYEAIKTGMVARTQPLMMCLTTAGHSRTSLCWEMHELSRQVVEQTAQLDSHFAYISTAEIEDDLQDPLTWWKANPNLDVTVDREHLKTRAQAAVILPSEENMFRNLHLNQWVSQADRWIPMSAWDACTDTIDESSLVGRRCYAALDLASTRDINALTLLLPLDDGRYAIKSHFWAPTDAMNERAERDRRQVVYWMEKGLIEGTDGNVADYDGRIPEAIMQALQPYDVRLLCYDPWGSAQSVIQRLVKLGFPEANIKEFRQTLQNFAGPTKEFERLVLDRKIVHNQNEVLRWMMSNVAVQPDANGNIRPHKAKSADKIDGIVAAIMALGVCIWTEQAADSVYETRGVLMI